MNHSLFAYLSAVLSLVGVPGLFPYAAKSDFNWLLRVQPSLRTLSGDELEGREIECRATTDARRTYLRRKSVFSLTWIFFAAATAAWMVYPQLMPCTATRQQGYGVASVIFFSWGTLGRLGWVERSYKGATIYEELDTFMFWFLYWLGTVCGVAAVVSPTF